MSTRSSPVLTKLRNIFASLPDVTEGTHSDAIASPHALDRLDHFEQQTRTARDRAAIGIGSGIRQRIDELVEQIAICRVNLDSIKACSQSVASASFILLHDVGHLDDIERPRRDERNEHPVGLHRWVGNTPYMPELEEDPSTRGAYCVGDEPPALDLLATVNAGCPRADAI